MFEGKIKAHLSLGLKPGKDSDLLLRRKKSFETVDHILQTYRSSENPERAKRSFSPEPAVEFRPFSKRNVTVPTLELGVGRTSSPRLLNNFVTKSHVIG